MNNILSLQAAEDTRPEDAPWSSISLFSCH